MKLSDFSLHVPEKKGPKSASSKSVDTAHAVAESAPEFASGVASQ